MSKVWLITGASRGLGRAFTEEALKAGHRVLATARNSEHLVDLASRFGESVRTVLLAKLVIGSDRRVESPGLML